jgi:hypothetical protein
MGGPGGGWGHMMGYGYGFGGMLMWIIFIAIFGVLLQRASWFLLGYVGLFSVVTVTF